MYIFLSIDFIFIILTWFMLRKFTKNWIDRPLSFIESILAGIIAWVFLVSLLLWFVGIVFTLHEFTSTYDASDIWTLIFSILITGYIVNFMIRSRSEMGVDDIQEFLKEAIQFRRSAQSRLDLLSLIQQRQRQRTQPAAGNDPESLQRARLQANLNKVKELDAQFALLREGTTIDLSEEWSIQTKMHSFHPFCEKVEEARIEPNRKRFAIFIDFAEFRESQFKDEMVVLRFNRQVYDFLQSMNSESWLRPYVPFFESYFLMCRAKRMNKDSTEVFYPFMKTGILVSELRKLESSYFNPRNLSEIAAVAFNHGAQV